VKYSLPVTTGKIILRLSPPAAVILGLVSSRSVFSHLDISRSRYLLVQATIALAYLEAIPRKGHKHVKAIITNVKVL